MVDQEAFSTIQRILFAARVMQVYTKEYCLCMWNAFTSLKVAQHLFD